MLANTSHSDSPVISLRSLMLLSLIAFTTLFLNACATQSKLANSTRPGWTYPSFNPDAGIVRSSPLHIQGRSKTRQLILDKAMVEFSKAQFGSTISLKSTVTKTTSAMNNSAEQRFQQTDVSEVVSANDNANVKASVKAEWYSPSTQELFLWVVQN